ncbi:unnamed protein product [Triticum turgidum subsp. durum]|uniref:Uncharacterized protein n=1 Tax=Triticum turgidum subsp. durum TaxID=4567 RepID=A0A9R1RUX4_TRITD|nr:unnamed protein product [Triticum turgidum subsp. durum]
MSTGVRRGLMSLMPSRLDELDASLAEELRRRPEVRIINKYAVILAFIQFGVKGMGTLTPLWGTAVLLGGFVSSLKQIDFWFLTIIVLLQAAGVSNMMGDARFVFFTDWIGSLFWNIILSWGEIHHLEHTQLTMRQWLKRQIYILISKLIDISLVVIFYPVAHFASFGPLLYLLLSAIRLVDQDYGIVDGDASKANLKQGLNIFYYLSFAHGTTCLFCMLVEQVADVGCVLTVCQQHGFSLHIDVFVAYLRKTKQMCVNNPASIMSWDLITYGANLLDSHLPEDYVSGARVLTMLIDHDTPLAVRQLLIISPRQRIQKLIGTLAWRSLYEQEMRWFAARIVEHLAGNLNLAHFPGALECISTLLDEEALLLASVTLQGTKDLVLPGLRIIENLAHDEHNCTLICNTKDLLSNIVKPIRSNELVEDIKSNAEWTKVVVALVKVVSRLMDSSGTTGYEMRRLIADDSYAVRNLEALLDMDMKINNSIIELQMSAIEVLTQLTLHKHNSTILAMGIRAEIIKRAVHIFLTTHWMGDYLKDEKRKIDKPTTSQENTLTKESIRRRMNDFVNKVCAVEAIKKETRMKEAKETTSQLKNKVGEALAMLSSDSEAVKSFTGCKDEDIHRLTELLNFNIKTIECKISATYTVEIDINIGCRISAAIILKHLSNYVKVPILQKMSPNSIYTMEDFVVSLKKMVEDNMYTTPVGLAIQKLTCKMVIEFMKHDQNIEMIDKHNIISTLLKASKAMDGLESRMLFSGNDHDCHGVPLKPLSSVLSKNAEELLRQRKRDLVINIAPAGVPPP